jgi:hypothetical protein
MRKAIQKLMAVGALAAVASLASAGAPTAPFTADADTILLMHFDSNLNDSSANGYNGTMSAIGGYSTPAYVASQSGFGQCLNASGGNQNGVMILNNAISQINSPLTIEAWINIPSSAASLEMNQCILDLGAGRLSFTLRNANSGGDTNKYLVLNSFVPPAPLTGQTAYAAIPPASWSYDTWHHVAVTYDVSRGAGNIAQFYFDGSPVSKNGDAITTLYDQIAFAGVTAGQVQYPPTPSGNPAPLNGSIDEVRVSSALRYGTGSTLLHLKFDGDYTDSSPYGWPSSVTSISGYTNPTFVTAATGYGQAIQGDGSSNLNGVRVTNANISLIPSPMTIDWRMYFPSAYAGQEFTNAIMDLGANRFYITMRHASNGYFHPMIQIRRGPGASILEYSYCSIPPADATHDQWHQFRIAYDSTQSAGNMVKFYFDNKPVTPEGATQVNGEYDKAAYNGLLAGRVWDGVNPTTNQVPLKGTIDDIKITSGVLGLTDNAVTVPVSQATITVDGNASDWASLASGVMSLNTGGRGTLTCNVRFAWNSSYLYLLAQESSTDTTQTEAANGTVYEATGPWSFDTVAFFMDLDNSNDNEQAARDFNPWFGFSSAGRTDLRTARINDLAALSSTLPFAGASVATAGTFAGHNRTIEARISWADLASTVNTARQPGGNLLTAVAAGYRFGCEPCLVDDIYDRQSFIGGSQYTIPSGVDANSRDLILQAAPSGVSDWSIY